MGIKWWDPNRWYYSASRWKWGQQQIWKFGRRYAKLYKQLAENIEEKTVQFSYSIYGNNVTWLRTPVIISKGVFFSSLWKCDCICVIVYHKSFITQHYMDNLHQKTLIQRKELEKRIGNCLREKGSSKPKLIIDIVVNGWSLS